MAATFRTSVAALLEKVYNTPLLQNPRRCGGYRLFLVGIRAGV